jgi:hypothetical protein
MYTFGDHAISNGEGVQHHCGELILGYYASGFKDESVFHFGKLYLYGGLFDIIAVALSHFLPIDPYELRRILCANRHQWHRRHRGRGAVDRRSSRGPDRRDRIECLRRLVGTMFNQTRDIPFAAAMMGDAIPDPHRATASDAPSARHRGVRTAGRAALGMRVLGLILLTYVGFAIAIYLPWTANLRNGRPRFRLAMVSFGRILPALVLPYLIMIVAWPWASRVLAAWEPGAAEAPGRFDQLEFLSLPSRSR